MHLYWFVPLLERPLSDATGDHQGFLSFPVVHVSTFHLLQLFTALNWDAIRWCSVIDLSFPGAKSARCGDSTCYFTFNFSPSPSVCDLFEPFNDFDKRSFKSLQTASRRLEFAGALAHFPNRKHRRCLRVSLFIHAIERSMLVRQLVGSY